MSSSVCVFFPNWFVLCYTSVLLFLLSISDMLLSILPFRWRRRGGSLTICHKGPHWWSSSFGDWKGRGGGWGGAVNVNVLKLLSMKMQGVSVWGNRTMHVPMEMPAVVTKGGVILWERWHLSLGTGDVPWCCHGDCFGNDVHIYCLLRVGMAWKNKGSCFCIDFFFLPAFILFAFIFYGFVFFLFVILSEDLFLNVIKRCISGTLDEFGINVLYVVNL